eukprot:3303555-Ditylum_brightwellii.AAC.1
MPQNDGSFTIIDRQQRQRQVLGGDEVVTKLTGYVERFLKDPLGSNGEGHFSAFGSRLSLPQLHRCRASRLQGESTAHEAIRATVLRHQAKEQLL